MSSGLKHELADHIYQYLCHEAQYSDLPEAAKESLTAASECIEQAYKLNVNSNQHLPQSGNSKANDGSGGQQQQQQQQQQPQQQQQQQLHQHTHQHHHHQTKSTETCPDELLRIFIRHKEFMAQQKELSQLPMTTRKKLSHIRAQIKRQASKENFKQKIVALLKKFRTDGSDFDSEEQYREALERELIKAAAGRGSRAIEELLEEDIDVEEESGSKPQDLDNISESSTPKPSLRPFFSSTTLDKI